MDLEARLEGIAMKRTPDKTAACPRSSCRALQGSLDDLLTREWLLTNGLGGFASGTVIGCPTRKYHGWLVASKRPPLERHLLLAGAVDRVHTGDVLLDLSSWEFNHGVEPAGYAHLVAFDFDPAGPDPWVRWTYARDGVSVRRQITFVTDRQVTRIRYDVEAPAKRPILLEVAPMLAMRDFHSLRRQAAVDPWKLNTDGHWLWVQDRAQPDQTLALFSREGEGLSQARFTPERTWWHNIRYRIELEREYLGGEDLQRAGTFRATGTGSLAVEFVAVGFAPTPEAAAQAAEGAVRPSRTRSSVAAGDPVRHALAAAADQFVVRRRSDRHRDQATIIAGYPWFGDWGRDSFICLEGLLLRTGRHAEAREVLETFAGVQRNGLIPNRFDDYGGDCEYNSVDASLWYVHAADAYLTATGDTTAWRGFLASACRNVVDAFVRGTDFDIRLDEKGLIWCGHPQVQITWMDAKCGDVVFTPRHGRPVEVNALWHHTLRILTQRFADTDKRLSKRCRALADQVAGCFEDTYWNPARNCLFDCVRDDERDAAIRPNQIFAVSLADSPLSAEKQAAVLETVRSRLLTPFGLRSLAPDDPHYIGRFRGVQPVRDRAYHNGTVWSWLIGPFVEAHLRVHGFTAEAKSEARQLLRPLIDHLSEACLGSISENFDGDPPHRPGGCAAQAWSVAELLRVWDLVNG